MRLAKPSLDIGLYTEDLDAHRRFWEGDVGTVDEGFQKLGSGVRQHRYGIHGSVIKVNHSRNPLSEAPTGLRRLLVASDRVTSPVDLVAPEGIAVRLVPAGLEGVTGLAVEIAASDPEATRRWWTDAVGATELQGDGRVSLGTTVIDFVAERGRTPTGGLRAKGFRYLTAQVHDVVEEHARMVAAGSDAPSAPTRLGDTAAIAFVRSPDGDWLELSQRAELTGSLPDI